MPRLQFSIRALLLLMTVVGAALVIYRWPWTVNSGNVLVTITTQYRRGWNGKALKHGLETKYFHDGIYVESWYHDGELRRERTTYGDQSVIDRTLRDNVEDGPYFATHAGGSLRGQFRQGTKIGVWQRDLGEVVRTETWVDGKLEGPRRWTAADGKVIQSADYERGGLIRWNGLPVPDAIRQWLAANIPAAELRERLQSPIGKHLTSADASIRLHYGQTLYFVAGPKHQLDVQWDLDDQPVHEPPLGQPIAESILELALAHDRTFAYRFGTFSIVPITPQQLAWRDRTGVMDLHFDAGSDAEKFWLEPTAFNPWYPNNPALRLNEIFEQNGSPLEIDTTAVDDLEPPFTGPMGSTLPPLPRPLRDQIGLHLDREGYYCELQDGKLVIKPHPDSKRLPRK